MHTWRLNLYIFQPANQTLNQFYNKLFFGFHHCSPQRDPDPTSLTRGRSKPCLFAGSLPSVESDLPQELFRLFCMKFTYIPIMKPIQRKRIETVEVDQP